MDAPPATAPDGDYPPGFLTQLRALLGEDGVRGAPELALLDPGVSPQNLRARALARPTDAPQTAAVLGLCARHRVGVVPQGGRTGLSGGAHTRPQELIVSLERQRAIESVCAASRTAVVQAGVTLGQLDATLAPLGLSAGIDLGARDSATLGGMAATNAGGIDAFRHGTMRERVLGLEVALADGSVLTDLCRVRKDNAGLPLRQLFVGSEGTLGVITRLVLALVPAGGLRHAALALVADLGHAINLMRALERDGRGRLVAAELMSANHIEVTASALGIQGLQAIAPATFGLLLCVEDTPAGQGRATLEECLAAAAGQGELVDGVLPKNAAEERDLWRIREDWSVDRLHPGGLWYDVSVPIDRLADYLDGVHARVRSLDPGFAVYVVGHLGDGNVHVTVNAAQPVGERYGEVAPLVYAGLRELGGSFSAEHGIGLEKRAALETWAGPRALELMRAVKATFDPLGILNPGKVLKARGR